MIQSGQVIANHQRAGTRHEDHALQVAQIDRAPSCDHDFLLGQDEAEAGNGFEDLHRGQGIVAGVRGAFDGVQEIDRNHAGPDCPQLQSHVTTIFTCFTHADDAAAADLDSGVFQKTDGFQTVFISVGGAMFREETSRTLKIVTVTGQSGLLQAVRHFLAVDQPQGSVRTHLAIGCHFPDAVAYLIQNRPLTQALPCRDQAHGRNVIALRLGGSFLHGLGVDEAISW